MAAVRSHRLTTQHWSKPPIGAPPVHNGTAARTRRTPLPAGVRCGLVFASGGLAGRARTRRREGRVVF